MKTQRLYRRTVRHFHEPGDVHEFTFSCYDRLPLLTNDTWRAMLAESIDRASDRYVFALHAFEFMPEHRHLLASCRPAPNVESYLAAIKRPYSYRIKQILRSQESPLLEKLTRPDKRKGSIFRYWQKVPGYDRNLQSSKAVVASLD